MAFELWCIYALAVLVLTATPGPSVFLCVTTSVARSLRASCYAAVGIVCAITGLMTLSYVGLGVLITQSEWAFMLIKYLGAIYLIYLGLKAWFASQDAFDPAQGDAASSARQHRSSFLSGFLVGISNPKALVFFGALFPQFIDPQASLWGQYMVLASTFVVLEFSWLMTYAYLGQRSRHWLMQEGRARWFNRITGSIFVGAGALLSTSSRVN